MMQLIAAEDVRYCTIYTRVISKEDISFAKQETAQYEYVNYPGRGKKLEPPHTQLVVISSGNPPYRQTPAAALTSI
jgi:hypothetical protein